jgi:hypothetical protein
MCLLGIHRDASGGQAGAAPCNPARGTPSRLRLQLPCNVTLKVLENASKYLFKRYLKVFSITNIRLLLLSFSLSALFLLQAGYRVKQKRKDYLSR